MPNAHHCGVCKSVLKTACIRKGHQNFCPLHPNKTALNKKECVSCASERKRIAEAERRKKLEEKEAERKRLERENDTMNRKGKERKPRASSSGGSASGLGEPAYQQIHSEITGRTTDGFLKFNFLL
ncbi:hypothetical protein MMC07_007019 [Pseudocyphellaria aurata]|nr:hypothetical protein [Pseudocyphellaria aurata]